MSALKLYGMPETRVGGSSIAPKYHPGLPRWTTGPSALRYARLLVVAPLRAGRGPPVRYLGKPVATPEGFQLDADPGSQFNV